MWLSPPAVLKPIAGHSCMSIPGIESASAMKIPAQKCTTQNKTSRSITVDTRCGSNANSTQLARNMYKTRAVDLEAPHKHIHAILPGPCMCENFVVARYCTGCNGIHACCAPSKRLSERCMSALANRYACMWLCKCRCTEATYG